MNALIQAFCVIMEAAVIFVFYKAVLKEPKGVGIWLVVVYVAYMTVAFVTFFATDHVSLRILCQFLFIVLVTICYMGKLWVKIFSATIICSIGLLVESVVGFAAVGFMGVEIQNIADNENAFFMMAVASKFLTFAFAIAVFFAARRKEFAASKKPVLLLTVLPITTIIVILQIGLTTSNENKITAIACYILLVATNFITFYLFERQSALEANKLQTELLRQQVDMQIEHYKQQSQENRETRAIRHNIKNVLLSLGGLLEKGDVSQAQDIIVKQTEQIEETANTVDTGNAQIDAVINAKQQRLQYRIITKIDRLCLKSEMEFDLAVMVALALDNAIEASARETAPRIGISIVSEKDMIIIKLENAFSGEVVMQGNSPISTKENKVEHGFGFETIKKLAKKYRGDAVCHCERGVFSINIFIKKC